MGIIKFDSKANEYFMPIATGRQIQGLAPLRIGYRYLLMSDTGWNIVKPNRESTFRGDWTGTEVIKTAFDGPNLSYTYELWLDGKVDHGRMISLMENHGSSGNLNLMDLGLSVQDRLSATVRYLSATQNKKRLHKGGPIDGFAGSPVILWGRSLGGYGFPQDMGHGNEISIEFRDDGLICKGRIIRWQNILDVSVGGPGVFRTGGGWWGGGVGISGALKGAALATIMNALTTRTHVETVIRLVFEEAELNLLISSATPEQIDVLLSPLRGYLMTNKRNFTSESRKSGSTKYCASCGYLRAKSAKFCSECGAAT